MDREQLLGAYNEARQLDREGAPVAARMRIDIVRHTLVQEGMDPKLIPMLEDTVTTELLERERQEL